MIKNIVLIGMPGCGKSTIGKLLSDETGLEFIDLDEYIVKSNGMTIEEMFEQGEGFFRVKETKAVKEVSRNSGIIISTGGGVIKRPENMNYLKEKGIIIFIHRSPEKIIQTLDNSVRPLLKEGVNRIYDLYEERQALYKKYGEIVINNDGNLSEAINEIKKNINIINRRRVK